jgi:thiol:disulfide interchange protein DsbD
VTVDVILPSNQLAAAADDDHRRAVPHRAEWHLYWNGHNDSGEAPTLDFSGSDPRLTFGAATWPVPRRHVAEGDIVDHIYEGDCVMLVPLTVEKGVAGDVVIKVRSEILVCREECLPGRLGASRRPLTLEWRRDRVVPDAATLEQATASLPRPMRRFALRRTVGGCAVDRRASSGRRFRG